MLTGQLPRASKHVTVLMNFDWLFSVKGVGFDHGKFWNCVIGFARLLNWGKLRNGHLTPARPV